MNAKEKAAELAYKFTTHTQYHDDKLGWVYDIDAAKQCALIAVDEIISALDNTWAMNAYYFWEEVKSEIEKL